jgi:enoyl-CoA hydratase/carnithine racemase
VARSSRPEAIDRETADLFDVVVTTGPGSGSASASRFVVPGGEEDQALNALEVSVIAHPLAAASLVMLLRGGDRRTIEEGLVAESTLYSLLQAGPEFAKWLAARPRRDPVDDPADAVLVERSGETLHLTLNRPARHNAFNTAIRDGLVEALVVAEADPSVEHVVVEGAGPSFCSGGDLDEFGSLPDPATAHVVRLTRSPARFVARLASRTRVLLHGACMGAGIELPAFAQYVVADPATRIALPELSLGLIPGAGGTVSLPRRIGRHRTAYLGLSGVVLDAGTALAWGLVDEVRPVPGPG